MEKKARRSRADGSETRRKILEAASRLVARQGFERTASKDVAREAGVDLASINYHFGSRKGLFEKALIEVHHELLRLEALRELSASALSPEEKLRRITEYVIRASQGEDGWKFQLLFRGLFENGELLAPLYLEEVGPKFELLRSIVSGISGIPEKDPAIAGCLFNTIAPLFTLLAFNGKASPVNDFLAGRSPREAALAISSFAISGLKAAGAAYRAAPAPEIKA